ncbi:reverse transcriptase domain-containing protein [Tanacetum coccineum]
MKHPPQLLWRHNFRTYWTKELAAAIGSEVEASRTTTPETAHAMPWATLKKIMTDKYCPRGEIKKIKTEMWNLKVKGTDVVAYSRRFQQLALMCSRMFPEEIDKIEKYIGGLPEIYMAGSSEGASVVGKYQGQPDKRRCSFDAISVMDWGGDVPKRSKPGKCDTINSSSPPALKRRSTSEKRISVLFLFGTCYSKEVEDKSEKKRLKDVPIVQDFPDVFTEEKKKTFGGSSQTRQVEFQIDCGKNVNPILRVRALVMIFVWTFLTQNLDRPQNEARKTQRTQEEVVGRMLVENANISEAIR